MTIKLGDSPQRPALLHVYPDIQHETERAKDMLHAEVDYSILARPDLCIFTGDLVNTITTEQWAFFAFEIGRLNAAGLKWILSPGNHDMDAARITLLNDYVTAGAWVTGAMEAGKLENTYTRINLGGRNCLFLCLEFGPRTAVVEWANTILTANPNDFACLVTHAYLYRDGIRYDWATYGEAQRYNPHLADYQFTPAQGIFDGQELWDNLVSLHSNLRLVMCGHDVDTSTGYAVNRRTDTRLGTTCHQLLVNYQEMGVPVTGQGIMREITLDFINQSLYCHTYSPYLRREIPGITSVDFRLSL